MSQNSSEIDIILRARDEATAHINGLSGSMRNLTGNLLSGAAAGISFGIANQVFNALGGALSFVGDSVVGFNAHLEQSRVAWTTMLGSAGAANAMLNTLQQFAATTPFEFPQLEESAKRMLAMGFAADRIIPILTSVGDAAAALGMGQEGISRITLALGQMQAKTKVSGDEMLQLTEAGIPAWRILSEAMGMSVADVQKLAESGKISSDVFIAAFQKFSTANYGGMMKAQSTTFEGAMSTIRDEVRITLGNAFEPMFHGISAMALALATFVSSPAFTEWGENLSRMISATGAFLSSVFSSGPIMEIFKASLAGVATVILYQLVPATVSAIRSLVMMGAAMLVANLPLVLLGIAATMLAFIIFANWDEISKATTAMAGYVGDRLGELGDWMSSTLWPFITSAAQAAWGFFAQIVQDDLNFISEVWGAFWGFFGASGTQAFGWLQATASAGWQGFLNIATFAISGVLNLWNAFVTKLQESKDSGVGLPGPLDAIAGKTVNVDEIVGNVSGALQAIPQLAVDAFTSVRTFVTENIPAAVGTAVNRLMQAGGDIGGFAGQLISDLQSQSGIIHDAFAGVGKQAGQSFANAASTISKPLVEELAKMLAQLRAEPTNRALEDAKSQVDRAKLVLADRRNTTAEERIEARRTIRNVERNVLPDLALQSFDVNRDVTLAGRPVETANLHNQILQNIRDQAAGRTGASAAGGGTGVGAGAVPSTPGATASGGGAPVVAGARAQQIQLHIVLSAEGQADQIYDELIEANGVAQIPATIQISGVRRN